MSKYYFDIEQGSDEWFSVRLGKITASNLSKVMAGGGGATRKRYLYQLAAERLSNEVAESYTNAAMEWGTQTEPDARAAYIFASDNKVNEIGFVEHNDYVGASPDGMIGEAGLLEIKCPNTATFIEYSEKNRLPPAYKAQVQGQLWICEREWCDFVAFDPRIIKGYMCIRIERDDEYIDGLKKGVNIFIHELKELVSKFD